MYSFTFFVVCFALSLVVFFFNVITIKDRSLVPLLMENADNILIFFFFSRPTKHFQFKDQKNYLMHPNFYNFFSSSKKSLNIACIISCSMDFINLKLKHFNSLLFVIIFDVKMLLGLSKTFLFVLKHNKFRKRTRARKPS